MKKLTPAKVNMICWMILLIGLILGLAGVAGGKIIIVTIGIIVMVCSILFRVMFYRCPHCGKFLDRSTGEYCPYCGKRVNG